MRGYCRAERFGKPGPFRIKPKAHAEKEETSKDEYGRPKLLGVIAEDRPVLGQPRSRKEKTAHPQRQPPQSSQTKGPTQ